MWISFGIWKKKRKDQHSRKGIQWTSEKISKISTILMLSKFRAHDEFHLRFKKVQWLILNLTPKNFNHLKWSIFLFQKFYCYIWPWDGPWIGSCRNLDLRTSFLRISSCLNPIWMPWFVFENSLSFTSWNSVLVHERPKINRNDFSVFQRP